jgi:D-glutamate cyclase
MTTKVQDRIQKLQDIVGTDAGNRGMKALIVQGDLYEASKRLAAAGTTVVLLSGFPCGVQHNPPTETDGPPGTLALARAAMALGWKRVVVVTDDCNREVFAAAMDDPTFADVQLEVFACAATASSISKDERERMKRLQDECELLIACERAGPSKDGHCYTMRATDMTAMGLIAPLDVLVRGVCAAGVPFVAIGDGGNEMGMGKVIDAIRGKIPLGDRIGCVIAADHLVAASVSNWGGYALAAGAAIVRSSETSDEWVAQCLPTVEEEIALLDRCVSVGCRDGVSGLVEATVDGMPLEMSLQCLRDITEAALV